MKERTEQEKAVEAGFLVTRLSSGTWSLYPKDLSVTDNKFCTGQGDLVCFPVGKISVVMQSVEDKESWIIVDGLRFKVKEEYGELCLLLGWKAVLQASFELNNEKEELPADASAEKSGSISLGRPALSSDSTSR